MAFMTPVANYFTKEEAIEYTFEGDREVHCLEDGPEADLSGWYSRLSANGYLDCTEWSGPFKTGEEALKYVMDLYEVDEHGNDLTANQS